MSPLLPLDFKAERRCYSVRFTNTTPVQILNLLGRIPESQYPNARILAVDDFQAGQNQACLKRGFLDKRLRCFAHFLPLIMPLFLALLARLFFEPAGDDLRLEGARGLTLLGRLLRPGPR